MKIHYLQHVPFEGLGCIEDWIKIKRHQSTRTRLYQGDTLPKLTDIDWLIIMGGPMNIYQVDQYPWLTRENQFIKEAINNKMLVLGICLGAQLITDALGAKVTKNPQKEIGWFPVTKADELSDSPLNQILPDEIEVFHWHGETFELPAESIKIASSKACKNQGFVYHEHVIALQFHLESTATSIKSLIDNCKAEITDAPFVQSPDLMLVNESKFKKTNELMFKILDYQESLRSI